MSVVFSAFVGACVAFLVFKAARRIVPGPFLARRAGRPGFVVPGLREFLFRGRRREQLRSQMPELLGALSASVRAGLSLPQAVLSAAGETGGAMGEELGTLAGELKMGGTLDDCLERFERRIDLPEARMMAAGLRLARRTGGNLAPLLEQIAGTLRERGKLKAQVKALTAQGRLSGAVVASAPFVLFAVMAVVDPEFIRPLFSTAAGWMILLAALLLEVIGFFGIRAAIRVES